MSQTVHTVAVWVGFTTLLYELYYGAQYVESLHTYYPLPHTCELREPHSSELIDCNCQNPNGGESWARYGGTKCTLATVH